MYKQFVCIVSFLVLLGCSQWGGSNPIGVTGGGNSGYGGETSQIDITVDYSQLIIGTWRSVETSTEGTTTTTMTFEADNEVYININDNGYNDYYYGTYTLNGNVLTLLINGDTITSTCTISNDKLYITIEEFGGTLVLTRVS
jgi:uncharacterized protein (TIGR03066 family)